MKNFLYLLMALPVLFGLSSCSDDDDNSLPEVNLSVSYSGATNVDGVLYVVEGDTFTIDGITVTPVEGTKAATLGATTYYWDYAPVATTIIEPFGMQLNTTGIPEGNHLLQIRSSVYQVDKSVATAYMAYKVTIVGAADDIPQPSGSGSDILPPNTTITPAE